jgi:hypothetical protein
VVVVVLITGAALGTWIAQWLQEPAGNGIGASAPAIPTVFGPRLRVEVLNGGGRDGMARAATGILRDSGYDVVEVGNWTTADEPSSFVLDRGGALEGAREVADALGVTEVRSEAEEDSNLYADVTVVLGQEWSPESIPISPGGEAAQRPWWDLRKYLRRPGAPVNPDARLVDPENDDVGR